MTESTKAVFLSYASQDADAARRLCDALRAAGLEVWFDQSELRGGDAWDASIRNQIKECALFVPIISNNTEARLEGYFRLEWRLADQRTHLMAAGNPFLLPVVVDGTKDAGARVPDSFMDVQWTRLADGDAAVLDKFAARVAKLVAGSASSGINAPNAAPVNEFGNNLTAPHPHPNPPLQGEGVSVTGAAGGADNSSPFKGEVGKGMGKSATFKEEAARGTGQTGPSSHHSTPTRTASEKTLGSMTGTRLAIGAIAAIIVISVGTYALFQSKSAPTTPGAGNASSNTPAAPFPINPLSVMVLPFANQTGDVQKAYIADALTSSITSDLSRIRDAFIVPAATAFSLKDKQLTVPQLGKEAAVRFVLTGSVTGDKEKLRINAVLSDTQTGAQLWTENFDGKQTDLFALQDQVTKRIGDTIAPQMVIVAARESEKRASKPEVADLLMRARALGLNQQSLKNHQAMEALYRQTLAIVPGNLNAKAGLAVSLGLQAENFANLLKLDEAGRIAHLKKAFDLAQEVKAIDPNNPDIYLPISSYAEATNDIDAATQAIKRQIALQPKASAGYNTLGVLKTSIDDVTGAKAALAKALEFASPVKPPAETYLNLARVAFREDKLDDAIAWSQKGIDANPTSSFGYLVMALAYARKGDTNLARKAAAEAARLDPELRLTNQGGFSTPWPGKEAAYAKFMDTQFIPAWRAAGLPE